MNGTIMNFRRARHHTYENQMIIQVEGVDSKEKAEGLVGKKVSWKSTGDKTIEGTISAPHGSKGYVRALFERGMPGQAISTKVAVI